MDRDFRGRDRREAPVFDINAWTPKTELGRAVKSGKVTSFEQLLDSGERILESEIVDALDPHLEVDYVNLGQAKGKFGGGKRRIIKQTQKKTDEGSKVSFCTIAIVGNKNGVVGTGSQSAAESMPAKAKSLRAAKINIMSVPRGCGSWECTCGEQHSLPYAVRGKCGSVRIRLMPAPKGTGLAVEKELRKVLKLAGYKDIWSKVTGQARKKENLVAACISALQSGVQMRKMEKVVAKPVEKKEEKVSKPAEKKVVKKTKKKEDEQ